MLTKEFGILLGFIALLIDIIICLILKQKPKKIIFTGLFICYLTLVAIITIFPIPLESETIYVSNVTWYNFIPFKTITEAFTNSTIETAILQVFGNVLLSVPFGFFIMIFLNKSSWWKLLLFAFGFTIAIETTQLIIGLSINNMYRNVDIDDIILNACGAYIGYGIYKLIPKRLKSWLK